MFVTTEAIPEVIKKAWEGVRSASNRGVLMGSATPEHRLIRYSRDSGESDAKRRFVIWLRNVRVLPFGSQRDTALIRGGGLVPTSIPSLYSICLQIAVRHRTEGCSATKSDGEQTHQSVVLAVASPFP